MTHAPPPRLGRSRTVRAAALVTVGLAATACDEAPLPDTPLDADQRLEACEAAHRRLSADPARCQTLERVAQSEQAATRPRFTLRADCEASFGAGACEGGEPSAGNLWRPVLAGWFADPRSGDRLPAVRDRQGGVWALGPPGQQPQPVTDGLLPPKSVGQDLGGTSFDRRAPGYDDRADCEAGWDRCEPTVLPSRFAEQQGCEAVWTRCQELSLPGTRIASGGGGSGGVVGGHGWSGHYNQVWFSHTGYAPRWQGWGWTADRAPAATYRPAGGGVAQAWDSGARRLAPARSLASIAGDGGALSSRTETVSRAGFGATGRSYSSGG